MFTRIEGKSQDFAGNKRRILFSFFSKEDLVEDKIIIKILYYSFSLWSTSILLSFEEFHQAKQSAHLYVYKFIVYTHNNETVHQSVPIIFPHRDISNLFGLHMVFIHIVRPKKKKFANTQVARFELNSESLRPLTLNQRQHSSLLALMIPDVLPLITSNPCKNIAHY